MINPYALLDQIEYLKDKIADLEKKQKEQE
jgi:hypothetical protein